MEKVRITAPGSGVLKVQAVDSETRTPAASEQTLEPGETVELNLPRGHAYLVTFDDPEDRAVVAAALKRRR